MGQPKDDPSGFTAVPVGAEQVGANSQPGWFRQAGQISGFGMVSGDAASDMAQDFRDHIVGAAHPDGAQGELLS